MLVIIISLLTFKKPEFNFVNSSEKTLEFISNHDHTLTLTDFQKLDTASFLLIDVRNNFDYSKGHLANAINIPKSQLLDPFSTKIFKEVAANNKPIIVYGENPETANAACIFMYQLGYDQIKLLSVRSFYDNKEFQITSFDVEKPLFDFAETMKKASIQPIKKVSPKKQAPPKKKKVITKPKKKKKMPEGGC